MKPEDIMIERRGTQLSFAQAIAVDRLSGAAFGTPQPYELHTTPGYRGDLVLILHRTTKTRPSPEYLITRRGEFHDLRNAA